MNTLRLPLRSLSISLLVTVAVTALALAVHLRVAQASDLGVDPKVLPAPIAGVELRPGVTLFVAKGGGRRDAADRLTLVHAELARRGYVFVEVVPDVENGDLQGFFVSYAPAK
jgi:hypothetical protein